MGHPRDTGPSCWRDHFGGGRSLVIGRSANASLGGKQERGPRLLAEFASARLAPRSGAMPARAVQTSLHFEIINSAESKTRCGLDEPEPSDSFASIH